MAFGVISLIHFLNPSSRRQPSITTLLKREAVICLGACSPGLGIGLFLRRKAETAYCTVGPAQAVQTGSGRGAPRVFPASFTPLAIVGEGVEKDGCPFCTSPLSYQAEVALVSTPQLCVTGSS